MPCVHVTGFRRPTHEPSCVMVCVSDHSDHAGVCPVSCFSVAIPLLAAQGGQWCACACARSPASGDGKLRLHAEIPVKRLRVIQVRSLAHRRRRVLLLWVCGCTSLVPDQPRRRRRRRPWRSLSPQRSHWSCFSKMPSPLLPTSLLPPNPPAAPPQPPAEDVDRYRRRFNMRMLVPGRPVKETPATPPPVPMERPTYREKFIPPELSMWDYFVAKVSQSAA